MYLARLISLVQKWPHGANDPLLQLVSNNYVPPSVAKKKKNQSSVFGNRYSKEITESMAMVDAVERALKLCLGRSSIPSARVYCVGDGKYPVSAAAMALHYPYPGWEFVSIDPLLEPLDLSISSHPHRLIQFTGLSQDYVLPDLPETCGSGEIEHVDIVIACHSHAPLQEFWDRVLGRLQGKSWCRAVAITMACCANYSDLVQPPSLVFDDYEVYSPKRQIRIYHDNLFCQAIEE